MTRSSRRGQGAKRRRAIDDAFMRDLEEGLRDFDRGKLVTFRTVEEMERFLGERAPAPAAAKRKKKKGKV